MTSLRQDAEADEGAGVHPGAPGRVAGRPAVQPAARLAEVDGAADRRQRRDAEERQPRHVPRQEDLRAEARADGQMQIETQGTRVVRESSQMGFASGSMPCTLSKRSAHSNRSRWIDTLQSKAVHSHLCTSRCRRPETCGQHGQHIGWPTWKRGRHRWTNRHQTRRQKKTSTRVPSKPPWLRLQVSNEKPEHSGKSIRKALRVTRNIR
jgi:hypothetical protein